MAGKKSNTKNISIIFDADGMVLRKVKVFSIRLSEKLKIPIEEILPFFKREFQLCLVGKADLKKELPRFMSKWGWNDSLDEILKFWFEGERVINTEIVGFAEKLKRKGVGVYMSTNNEKYRVNYMLDNVGLRKYFDGIFASAEIGHKKPDKEFYQVILDKINPSEPYDVQFWDDDMKNVSGAENAGLDAHLYGSFRDFKKCVNAKIKISD